jgi:thiamine pyrophosphokinase
MKAVVVSHGEVKDFEYIRKVMAGADLIVCADGGCEYVIKCGLIPDALIGDLDSIDYEILEVVKDTNCCIIRYPREKDYTDTELAVNYALDQGSDEIILLAGTGDRLDHSLANIFLLVKLLNRSIKACLINENNTVYITNNTITLKGNIGDLVSLIPVGGDVEGIYTDGLQYRLSGHGIKMGEPLGISNVFTNEEVNVRIKSGILLVIKSFD